MATGSSSVAKGLEVLNNPKGNPKGKGLESKNITLLRNLDVSKDEFVMKLRILRIWKLPDFKVPSEAFAIEMILMDEEGLKIQASVLKRWIPKFQKFLAEYETLDVENPNIGLNTGKYKYVDNQPNKLTFGYKTNISRCDTFSGSKHGFDFANFRSIFEGSIQDGAMIGSRSNKDVKRLNMEVEDLSGLKINLTLFDNLAQTYHDYMLKPRNGRVVLILQFAKFGWFRENPGVKSYFDITKLFIDTDMDEINLYKNSLLCNNLVSPSIGQYSANTSQGGSLEDEFIKKFDFKFISDINEINEVKSLVIIGTIKLICNDEPWYYLGCKHCSKKVRVTYEIEDKEDGSCDYSKNEKVSCVNPDCADKPVETITRYRIQLRVQDGSGVVSLTMWDHNAQKILKITAKDLLEKSKEVISDKEHPKELDVLLGKKYAFKIDLHHTISTRT